MPGTPRLSVSEITNHPTEEQSAEMVREDSGYLLTRWLEPRIPGFRKLLVKAEDIVHPDC